jgi:hypothetical protein
MSSQPFLRAVSDFVMDISGLVNIRPTPGITDNSGIRFYRGNGSYVGLTANSGSEDIIYSFPPEGSPGEVLSFQSGGELNWVSAQSGEKGDKGDTGEKGDLGDPGVKGDTGAPGNPGFSAAVYNFAGMLAGSATLWGEPPPQTAGGGVLTESEFLNLEGLSTLTPAGVVAWPTYPAVDGGSVIPGTAATTNNNFFGRVLPANGHVTFFAVNFLEKPDRDVRIRIAIANSSPGPGLTSQLVDEEIIVNADSSPYGSLAIPVALSENASFAKGSYIFALSFADNAATLKPIGLISVSVYVNFDA